MRRKKILKVLFIGDIVGSPGRKALANLLDQLVKSEGVDMVIVNGENAAGGFGITPKIADELLGQKVDVITTGNHVWDKKDILPYLATTDKIIRPANYPDGVEGRGSTIVETQKGNVGVLQLMGRVFMLPIECPFKTAKSEIKRLKSQTDIIIIDMHAEATSEKIALCWYLDGMVSAVVGTHTHVQTADEKIFPGGTAYITDVGMTGPEESVIGVKPECVVEKFLTQTPKKFNVANGHLMLNAVVLDIELETGRAANIKRLQLQAGYS